MTLHYQASDAKIVFLKYSPKNDIEKQRTEDRLFYTAYTLLQCEELFLRQKPKLRNLDLIPCVNDKYDGKILY